MLNQKSIDYIKSRVSNCNYETSGDIKTICNITLDDGRKIEGISIREVNGFNQEEANIAAYIDAIEFLYPGVDLILEKKI